MHRVTVIPTGSNNGLLEAYAEGFNILRHASDTLPRDQRFDFDVTDVA